MRPHLDVLGWLHCLWGGFGLLTGGSLGLLAIGADVAIGGLGGGPDADRAAVWLLGSTGAVLGLVGAVMVFTGRGLLRRSAWSRHAALWLAVPNFIVLPFGTALGAYTFWTLLNDDARRTFGRPARVAAGPSEPS